MIQNRYRVRRYTDEHDTNQEEAAPAVSSRTNPNVAASNIRRSASCSEESRMALALERLQRKRQELHDANMNEQKSKGVFVSGQSKGVIPGQFNPKQYKSVAERYISMKDRVAASSSSSSNGTNRENVQLLREGNTSAFQTRPRSASLRERETNGYQAVKTTGEKKVLAPVPKVDESKSTTVTTTLAQLRLKQKSEVPSYPNKSTPAVTPLSSSGNVNSKTVPTNPREELELALKDLQDYKRLYEEVMKKKKQIQLDMDKFKDDITELEDLKKDNDKLKGENGALIRVISKMTHTKGDISGLTS